MVTVVERKEKATESVVGLGWEEVGLGWEEAGLGWEVEVSLEAVADCWEVGLESEAGLESEVGY